MKHLSSSRGHGAVGLVLGAVLALSLAAPAAAANPTRPFMGTANGESFVLLPAGHCPEGAMFYLTDSGLGIFTHLGRFQYSLAHCATLLPDGATIVNVGNGSMTAIAANGDRLFVSYTFSGTISMVPAPTASGHLDWWVTGGTGRFAAATGDGSTALKVAYGDIYLTTATSSFVWRGTISY